jgi:hypothetical protein
MQRVIGLDVRTVSSKIAATTATILQAANVRENRLTPSVQSQAQRKRYIPSLPNSHGMHALWRGGKCKPARMNEEESIVGRACTTPSTSTKSMMSSHCKE